MTPTAEVGVGMLACLEPLPSLSDAVLSPLRPTPASAPALRQEIGASGGFEGGVALGLLELLLLLLLVLFLFILSTLKSAVLSYIGQRPVLWDFFDDESS